MSNQPGNNIPSRDQVAELQDNFQGQCDAAAKELAEADVLLLVTGAGFSADSGLAVYGDVAQVQAYKERNLEYSDISQPVMIDKDPELFYGFWGQCFNDYRKTKPHRGYKVIARWRDDKNKATAVVDDIRACVKKKVEGLADSDIQEHGEFSHGVPAPYIVTGTAGAFYVFTSNADAHSYDHFEAHEINDCHGNVELWQCSNRECSTSGIWQAPLEHEFLVHPQTMLAPQHIDEGLSKGTTTEKQVSATDDNDVPHIGQTKGVGKRAELLRNMPTALKDEWHQEDGTNWPKCHHCGSLARPAVFMFGDFGWKYDMEQEKRWNLWREAVLDLGLKVCIMEVGCGLNVPTCRSTSEQMVEDLLSRGAGSVKLVRINPDFPLASEERVAEHTISILSRGLTAIEQIDEFYCSYTN